MKDISLITLGMFGFGVLLWMCYGILIHAVPVIVWNALSLSLYAIQIGLKLRMGESDPQVVRRHENLPSTLSVETAASFR